MAFYIYDQKAKEKANADDSVSDDEDDSDGGSDNGGGDGSGGTNNGGGGGGDGSGGTDDGGGGGGEEDEEEEIYMSGKTDAYKNGNVLNGFNSPSYIVEPKNKYPAASVAECRVKAHELGYTRFGYRVTEKSCFFYDNFVNADWTGDEADSSHVSGCTDASKTWENCDTTVNTSSESDFCLIMEGENTPPSGFDKKFIFIDGGDPERFIGGGDVSIKAIKKAYRDAKLLLEPAVADAPVAGADKLGALAEGYKYMAVALSNIDGCGVDWLFGKERPIESGSNTVDKKWCRYEGKYAFPTGASAGSTCDTAPIHADHTPNTTSWRIIDLSKT